MKSTSKITIAIASLALGVFASSLATAGNVANTAHNFSAGGSGGYSYQSASISEVCIFCHTPHNAGTTRLLWNKAKNSSPNFRLYTSSGTLSSTVRLQSSLSGSSPSLLCLSCHDGKTAMNVLHSASTGNTASATGDGYPAGSVYIELSGGKGFGPAVMPPKGPYDFFSGTYGPSKSIGLSASDQTSGTNLTDDHPIGFSYSDVAADTPTRINAISVVNTKSSGSVRFFGAKQNVECSSCHDPHVDYSPAGNPALKPFLVMSNAQSALCLACHNK